MARRFSRKRFVKGRPNYCWITTCGVGTLASGGAGTTTLHDNVLIPSDWQSGNIVENETTVVHIVYTHAMYGVNESSIVPFCGLYAIVKTGDTVPGVSPANISDPTLFPVFFTEYDECLHWGQYTCMPYSLALNKGNGVWPAGGSLAGMPENMVTLNTRRKLKGDAAIKVMWGSPSAVGQESYYLRWYARSLVRLGLK